MKKTFLSVALLFAPVLSSMAIGGPKVEMEGKKYDCTKNSSEVFHCESDGKRILVVKSPMGFSAYEKKGDELPTMKWVTKVEDGIKVLYETPKFNFPTIANENKGDLSADSNSGGYGGGGIYGGMMGGGYTPPDTKATRMMNANGIIMNLKSFQDDWAKEFVNESKQFVEQEKASKSKATVFVKGKEYSCTRGEDKPLTKEEEFFQSTYNIKIQCNFFACTNMGGEKVLSYIPAPGTLEQPYIVNLKGSETDVLMDDFKIYDSDKKAAIPLYDFPKISSTGYGGYGSLGQSAPEFDQNLLIPAKYEKNSTTYTFYTSPENATMRADSLKQCVGDNETSKLIEEDRKIADIFQNEMTTMELSHYLTMLDGRMIALVVDATKGNSLGCSYADMILSQKAREHLNYLQKARPKPVSKTISEKEVQELFLKAKSMEDVPFGYKYDGCYARAHVMARRFEAMGIPTEKVWIKGSLFVPDTDVQWNYHVAPVINVKNKKGELVKYVIDPSLNDKAVTVDEWVASMGKNVKGGVMKTSYPFPVNIAQFQRTAVAISSSDIYVPDNDELRSEEQNMQMAVQTMKDYSQALKEMKNE